MGRSGSSGIPDDEVLHLLRVWTYVKGVSEERQRQTQGEKGGGTGGEKGKGGFCGKGVMEREAGRKEDRKKEDGEF